MTEQYPIQNNTNIMPSAPEDDSVALLGHNVSKRTGGLILVLFILTAIVLFFALQGNTPPPANKIVTTPTITPTPFAQSSLQLQPVDDHHTNVIITTGANKVTLVHLEMAYDPKITTITDIAPGTFFTNPVMLLKNIDPVKGTISYTLAIQPVDNGVNGSGTVATITYNTTKPSTMPSSLSATGNTSPITILPATIITAQGVRNNVWKK